MLVTIPTLLIRVTFRSCVEHKKMKFFHLNRLLFFACVLLTVRHGCAQRVPESEFQKLIYCNFDSLQNLEGRLYANIISINGAVIGMVYQEPTPLRDIIGVSFKDVESITINKDNQPLYQGSTSVATGQVIKRRRTFKAKFEFPNTTKRYLAIHSLKGRPLRIIVDDNSLTKGGTVTIVRKKIALGANEMLVLYFESERVNSITFLKKIRF